MSAFSFPGENLPVQSSAASGPQIVPASSPRSLPTAPSNPRLPKPPGRGAINLDSTLEAQSDSPSRASPGSATAGPSSDQSEAAEWQTVYHEFVALKQQCGENTEGFTYDKFEAKLKDTRAALMSRHGAKRVKFSVHVKDGKAALKASPLKA